MSHVHTMLKSDRSVFEKCDQSDDTDESKILDASVSVKPMQNMYGILSNFFRDCVNNTSS